MRNLVIVGCGGFGREVVNIVDAINRSAGQPVWNIMGFLDDEPSQSNQAAIERLGLPHLGRIEDSRPKFSPHDYFIIAMGDPSVRRLVEQRLMTDDRAATLIDPRASLGRDVRISAGTVVGAGAHLTTNISVGRHVHIDRGVQVGHDCVIEDFVTIHPAATISGGCRLEQGARIGTTSTVLPQLRVGGHAFIGAASCVTRDVPSNGLVKGVPAR
ncbi:acetyltransferase [Pseudactinotalea sp. Z1748]|uniref:acetyltransferase n=1 Tax=Pseudactinotalea sp. Z1748 TaxID=3413027 RepID=UPI003C7DD882